jgi:hypothetical protein
MKGNEVAEAIQKYRIGFVAVESYFNVKKGV